LDFGDSSTSPFVSTISVPASFQQLLNAQWAYANGPLIVQSEWYATFIDQDDAGSLFFHGSYLQASYFLAGGDRAYQAQQGVFGAVTVENPVLPCFSSSKEHKQRGWGAWEATVRGSYLDFFDQDTPLGPQGQLVGVRMPQFTTGLNWYLADRLRILLNYTLAIPDEPNSGTSKANQFAMRLGVFW
jgi:phosphate-selective porin OprO/OprP